MIYHFPLELMSSSETPYISALFRVWKTQIPDLDPNAYSVLFL